MHHHSCQAQGIFPGDMHRGKSSHQPKRSAELTTKIQRLEPDQRACRPQPITCGSASFQPPALRYSHFPKLLTPQDMKLTNMTDNPAPTQSPEIIPPRTPSVV
eukprot:3720180-Amphidinium_carterae.1